MEEKLSTVLACPVCRQSSIEIQNPQILCTQCGIVGEKQKQFRFFSRDDLISKKIMPISPKNYFQHRFPKTYLLAVKIFSPVLFLNPLQKKFLRSFDWSQHIVANLGSGVSQLHPELINIDLAPYSEVHLTCSVDKLPLRSASLDGVMSFAALEHIKNPIDVVDEIKRVLKPNGLVYAYIPFIQGFHAAPSDFQRYTIEGLRHLFRDFEILQLKPEGGPTSGFLWVYQEWLAITFSLGSKLLYRAWLVFFMLLLWPWKFLDLLLIHHPMASQISTAFAIIARKKPE